MSISEVNGSPKEPSDIINTLKLLQQSNSGTLSENWEEFQKRVVTYIGQQDGMPLWLLKPLSLSPTSCSQYGWECVGVDLLKCVTCHSTLCAKLPKPWKVNVYQECLKEVVKCLKSSHNKHCPWRVVPSPDSFVRLVPIHKSQAFRELLDRLETLLTLGSSLPVIDESTIKEMELSDENLKQFCQMAHVDFSKINKSAMLLSASGWKKGSVRNLEKQSYIVCDHCHREIGLWFYNCHESDSNNKILSDIIEQTILSGDNELEGIADTSEGNEEEHSASHIAEASDAEEPSQKKLKTGDTDKKNFNPLAEHRHWCPWVVNCKNDENGNDCKSQSLKIFPGWKTFLQCLKRNLQLSPSPQNHSVNKQNINRARTLLESWTSDIVYDIGRKEELET